MNDSILSRETVSFGDHGPLPLQRRLFDRRRSIRHILIIGTGDVVRNRYWPAIQPCGLANLKIGLCGLEPFTPLNTIPHDWFQIEPGNLLPMDELARHGYLDGDTLFLIATPSELHVHYTLQLIGRGRVATEKPLASNCRIAGLLWPFTTGFDLHAIDHYLCKADFLWFRRELAARPRLLDSVARVQAVCHERHGFAPRRCQEDTIGDVQYHQINILTSVFGQDGVPFEVTIDTVRTAKHRPDPRWIDQVPRVTTASRIQGRLQFESGREVEFDLEQAKAAPADRKFFQLLDRDNGRVAEIDLSESGWPAHGRVLTELTTRVPKLGHTLADAIKVTELVDLARAKAEDNGFYPYGELPKLRENQSDGQESPVVALPVPINASEPVEPLAYAG